MKMNSYRKILSLCSIICMALIPLTAQVEVNQSSNVGIKTTPFELSSSNYYPELSLLGRMDMRYPTSGLFNIVLGKESGGAITNGNGNILFGANVGSSITSGNSNVVLGSQSGNKITDKQYNLFMGTFTGNNFDSERNVAIGWGAGSNTTTNTLPTCIGDGNLLLGSLTGQTIQGSAHDNVLIGFRAGWNIENLSDNIMIGPRAGENITNNVPWTNSNNIFIGAQAGQNAQNPNNIFIGSEAGRTATGSSSILIGAKAGSAATGNSNIFVGSQTGQNATGEANIFIGKKVGFNSTESNRLMIDNNFAVSPLIYGEFDNDLVQINGDLDVTGTITAPVKNFTIDHPLDPENKKLVFASIEAPEMINMFRGNVVTDENGFATVNLPDYFSTSNIEISYHLTCIGVFAQAIVNKEVEQNQFVIQTDQSNVKVSWQVLAKRADQWAKDNPLIVEQEKE